MTKHDPFWGSSKEDIQLLHKSLGFHNRMSKGTLYTLRRLTLGGIEEIFMKPLEAAMENPHRLELRRETWTLDQIREIQTVHHGADPTVPDWPIVVCRIRGRDFLVDGNNRINLWKRERREDCPVLLVIVAG